jgi:predicted permease
MHVLTDLRYAVRSLRKAPLFTTIAILSLSFGIAANSAVFTLVDQVVLRTLPVERPGELVQVSAPDSESYGGGMGDGTELSYAMYKDLRDGNRVFSGMFCRMSTTLRVGSDGTTEQVAGELVSGSFFPLLGLAPAAGRLLDARDDRAPGAAPFAVLSHAYWRSRFAGDPAIIGRTVTINNHPFEIVGVVEPRFVGLDLGQPAQVYVPVTMQPQLGPAWLALDGRRFRWVQVYARLAAGVPPAQARAGLQPLYRALLEREVTDSAFAKASAETRKRFLEGRLAVEDASRGRSGLRRSVTGPLLILTAIAVVVLLVVCANVANLLIARGAARSRELALRLAIGAGRGRIVSMLLAESLVLACAGTAAGLLLASWGAGALIGFFVTPDGTLAVSASPDLRILAFTVGIAGLTAIGAGLVPAVRSARVALAPALKSGGGTVVAEQPRLRKSLVVVQVALSFVLLVGAGLFLRSLQNLLAVDPGFRTERMVTFGFNLGGSGYDSARAHTFLRGFEQRLARLPGVVASGYTFIPVLGGGAWGLGFTIEGYQPPPGKDANSLVNAVSPGYFRLMGIELLEGREFTDRDDQVLPAPQGWPYRHAVVNVEFAKRYFNGDSPIGRHIGIGEDPDTATPIEIVGLVRDTRYLELREEQRPQVYFPYLQAGDINEVNAFVRTSGDPSSTMALVRREMATMDRDLAVYGITTLDEIVQRSVVNERLIATLSSTLSVMATLLSIVGLYGVMAYTVTRRTREIGIRMALGAVSRQVAGGVLREASLLVAAGLVAGGATTWALGRFVRNQLYGVSPADPATLLAASVALAAVATAAALLPARRAARVNPMVALRDE